MPQQLPPTPWPDLASTYRELYRARFRANVQAGITTPFIVPLHLCAYWVVPTLYLAIPHRGRPWLYRARWLILAFICAFNWYMTRNVASLNFVSSYGAGLLAAWATVWNFTLLVWTRPQWDARRVERRRIIRPVDRVGNGQELRKRRPSHPDAHEPNGQVLAPPAVYSNALEPRQNVSTSFIETEKRFMNGNQEASGITKREAFAKQSAAIRESTESMEGETEGKLLARDIIALNNGYNDKSPRLDEKTALQLSRLAREQEYEYYWQEYPADASLWTRLDWAFDIVSSFRLTGWNWAPSCLPPYEVPPRVGPYQLPLEYGPQRSKKGYERTLSRQKLIFSRWFFNFIPSYLILDLCATIMTTDPYFIVGPEHNYPLPPHLASLHPVLLSLQRTIVAFIGIFSAIQYAWNFGAICLALYCPPILGFRAHPWHLPSVTGSFTQVMDHGLAGFWGAWWHQSFRVGFSAPTKWLLRHDYLSPPRRNGGGGKSIIAMMTPAVGAIIAFTQSGLIHAAGSYSSVPPAHYWGPPLFFALSGLGTLLQSVFSYVLRHRIKEFPRWMRRLGNLSFVFLWLWATSWVILDDFGRSGIWLWEPVPVSLARAAGFGVDRRVWRYDWDSLPRWQWRAQGKWWQTGIAI
ncbi:hypothetical protein GGS24DRAFT_477882 [Hypoxylon argillaceum]|nr:hypothetical protein GGS24DRAFT_477882 [Hypoxylon argillaceum]